MKVRPPEQRPRRALITESQEVPSDAGDQQRRRRSPVSGMDATVVSGVLSAAEPRHRSQPGHEEEGQEQERPPGHDVFRQLRAWAESPEPVQAEHIDEETEVRVASGCVRRESLAVRVLMGSWVCVVGRST